MSDKCPKCGSYVALSCHECPVCTSRDIGYPNVRMAQRSSESEALDRRVVEAEASADAIGTRKQLEEFTAAVRSSHAVMNRSLGALNGWITAQSPLFLSYHHQLESGRIANGTEWDEQRAAAEAAINPYCFRELNFAALSLDKTGMSYYGPYAVVLKEITIDDRATVFEENPFYFNKRYTVVAGTSPPSGYRAIWSDRERLAKAKLHSKIQANTTVTDAPAILMEDRRNEPDCDFIEVHVYGPINRVGIEGVTGPNPKRRQDRAIWKQVTRSLVGLGATVEETK